MDTLTDPEHQLAAACEHLMHHTHKGLRGFVLTLAGWEGGALISLLDVAREVVSTTPTPIIALPAALDELAQWSERYRGETLPLPVRARVAILAEALDTLPDPTFEGVEARLRWHEHMLRGAVSVKPERIGVCLPQLHADLIVLRDGQKAATPRAPAPARTGPKTRTAASCDMLKSAGRELPAAPAREDASKSSSPALSDARACGVAQPEPASSTPQDVLICRHDAASPPPVRKPSKQPETREALTSRMDRVTSMLRDPETAALSNREIARRLGVSPQTVINHRTRLEAEAA